MAQNASLAIFGTNSEAASLSVAERLALTDALLEAGIPAARLMPGTGASALTDAVELTRHASRAGAAGVLMLPPFFYKGVSDDGVFAYYAEVIERVGSGCAPIYLYHIPQVTQVPITLALIERLLKRYPEVVAGAKDSSGDWNNSKAMIDTFAGRLRRLPGERMLLSQVARRSAAPGCISATVNMNPAAIRRRVRRLEHARGPGLQAKADAIRRIFEIGADDPGDEARVSPILRRAGLAHGSAAAGRARPGGRRAHRRRASPRPASTCRAIRAPESRTADHEDIQDRLHSRRRHRQGSGAGGADGARGAGRSAAAASRFEFEYFGWGGDYYRAHGVMMPADGLDALRDMDAILFGSAGDPHIPDHITLWGLRLKICQGFDQYANVRPTRILPGSTPRSSAAGRTTSTGSSCARTPRANTPASAAARTRAIRSRSATDVSMMTRAGVERIMRFAFGSRSRGRASCSRWSPRSTPSAMPW